jgi:hypothetical protein
MVAFDVKLASICILSVVWKRILTFFLSSFVGMVVVEFAGFLPCLVVH